MTVLGMPDDWEAPCATAGRSSRRWRTNSGTTSAIRISTPTPTPWNFTPDDPAATSPNYDLMSTESSCRICRSAQSMETGWVRPDWVRSSTSPVDDPARPRRSRCTPARTGAPPAGRFARSRSALPTAGTTTSNTGARRRARLATSNWVGPSDTASGAVFGTDVDPQSFTFPIARPQIIRLRPDAEGENSFFMAGQDYKETDTIVMAVADFKMSVLSDRCRQRADHDRSTAPTAAPTSYIRPWPGGDNWQSPDIEVRNARSIADPANWFNVPWDRPREHGRREVPEPRPGDLPQRQGRLLREGLHGRRRPRGVARQRHPRRAARDRARPFVEFATQWIPPNDGHRCIIARTPLFLDTSVNPTLVEVSDSNNWRSPTTRDTSPRRNRRQRRVRRGDAAQSLPRARR